MLKNKKEILILGCYLLAFLLFLTNKNLELLVAIVAYFDYKFLKK